ITVDGTSTFLCASSNLIALATSPSQLKLKWSNDAALLAGGSSNAVLESSADRVHFSTIGGGSASSFFGMDYSLPSSCASSAATYCRAGNARDANSPVVYGPTVKAKPSMCLATPQLTASPGGRSVILNLSYPNPVPGAPTPDKWVLYRRENGEVGFGNDR